jgi:hypothetical protein
VFRVPGRTKAEVAQDLSGWLCKTHFSTPLDRRKYRLLGEVKFEALLSRLVGGIR